MTDVTRVSAGSAVRTAMETRDIRGVTDAFAPDAELHSPLTGRLLFKGHEQIAMITGIILQIFEDLHYTDELMGKEVGFLVGRANIDGLEIEWVDHFRFGADGRITAFTVFFRPLPATAAALRRIGAALGRRKSPARSALVSALSLPLAWMTRVGDAVGIRLLRGTL